MTTSVQIIFRVSFMPSIVSLMSPMTGEFEVMYLMIPRKRNIVQIVTIKDLIFRLT